MREYKTTDSIILTRLICNCCGKVVALRGGIPMEGVCAVRQSWGYPSEKDGEQDSFDLCEACYDRITGQFKVPVTRTEQIEWL